MACSSNQPETEPSATENEEWQAEMYEPSELVIIMRQMYDENFALKAQIEAGEVPAEVPAKYREMLTAKSTDSDDLGEPFHSMAITYLANYETLTQADSATAVKKYNVVVESCIACHQNYCLGPIPKIEKLYIK